MHNEAPGPVIFIVDDDAFLVSLYEKKAKELGVELHVAKNATIALEELQRGFTPDVIALDVTMLGMSGIELLKTIRAEKLIPHSHVVILSNTTDESVVGDAKALGVEKFIVKASSLPPQILEELLKIAKGVSKE